MEVEGLDFIKAGSDSLFQIEKESEPTVYFGSIFSGMPDSKVVNQYYLMDSNVFNCICKNQYPDTVLGFIEAAEELGVELNPAFAIMEIIRTAQDPRGYLEYYRKNLRDRFGVSVSEDEIDAFYNSAKRYDQAIRNNVELIEDYLAIVKSIYNGRGDEEKKVGLFLDAISRKELPQFAFVILVGLIMIFVRHNLGGDESIRKKVDKFMSVGMDYASEERKLHNCATDVSLFIGCQEIAAGSRSGTCEVASIVTCDEVVGYILKNLCVQAVESLGDNRFGSWITIRGSSSWLDKMRHYHPLMAEALCRSDAGSKEDMLRRRVNLKNERIQSIKRYLKC